MTTENLQQELSMAANGTTESWYVHIYRNLALSVEWFGADANTGVIELENSVDNINWNCYGGDAGAVTLNAATGYQIFEVINKASPYFRFKYTKNTVTAGTMIIRTYGTPLHRMT